MGGVGVNGLNNSSSSELTIGTGLKGASKLDWEKPRTKYLWSTNVYPLYFRTIPSGTFSQLWMKLIKKL